MAYTEAIHRLQDSVKFIQSKRSRGSLPAPELDMLPPDQRVEHYMDKLHKYILVDERRKKVYNNAARIIQTKFRQFLWRRTRKQMESTVLVSPLWSAKV
jgi:hypothetical protein